MKKWFKYISCLLLVLLLFTGCKNDNDKGNDSDNLISLGFGNMNATGFIELDSTEALIDKIDNKDDFILLVYATWCPHCTNFKPILNEYVTENSLIVYGIQVELIYEIDLIDRVEYVPSLVVYNDGKLVDVVSDVKYLSSVTDLDKFFEKYTYSPVAYYLSLEQLREKKTNEENFVVYFTDNDESSNYLNNNYLKRLFDVYRSDKEFYVLDLSAYDSVTKQAIKDEFGLSEAGSETFGYGNGVAPTFQFYNDGILTDMAVFANDEVEVIDNEGVISYKVIGSYYLDNIHYNQTILASEYYDIIDGFYDAKINSFLSQYLKFVD